MEAPVAERRGRVELMLRPTIVACSPGRSKKIEE